MFRNVFGDFGGERGKPESRMSSSLLLSLGGVLVPCGYNRCCRQAVLFNTKISLVAEFSVIRIQYIVLSPAQPGRGPCATRLQQVLLPSGPF
jgi:hypothetical protein